MSVDIERLEEIAHRLRTWADAYPPDIFRPMTEAERDHMHQHYPGRMDRVAAEMGRHIGHSMRVMADEIEKALKS